jgi:hypothetical protein
VSIRTPPHLVARSSSGIPPDALAILFSRAPVGLVDTAASWFRRVIFGDFSGVGLPTPSTGVYSTVWQSGRIPTLAEQLVSRVRSGAIEIVAAVASFDEQNIQLVNGDRLTADTVIAATGFRHAYNRWSDAWMCSTPTATRSQTARKARCRDCGSPDTPNHSPVHCDPSGYRLRRLPTR